jgi:Cu-processing system permease protein
MLLLLSYPVARRQVLLGKFLGHIAVLTFATCLGYGLAAVALVVTGNCVDNDSLEAFAAMIGSSVLLGAVFVAIGYLVSALARDRGTAAGVCIGPWLLLVLIYDMALLGLLALDQGRNICRSPSLRVHSTPKLRCRSRSRPLNDQPSVRDAPNSSTLIGAKS